MAKYERQGGAESYNSDADEDPTFHSVFSG
jgi:hypothetical protein